MNIDAILITVIVLVLVYMVVLISLGLRLNRSYTQAGHWNRVREHLATRAKDEQRQAQQIKTRLHNQYGNLGKPYADDRDQAFLKLEGVLEITQKVLKDQQGRDPITSVPAVNFWRALCLLPLWQEYRTRLKWFRDTTEFQSEINKNRIRFQKVAQLEKELNAKGERVKIEFVTLQDKITSLITDFEKEARTPVHYQEQIQDLKQKHGNITQLIQDYLSDQPISPQKVAIVLHKLEQLEGERELLNQDLKVQQQKHQKTREQLHKNREIITNLQKILDIENEAQRPTPTFQDQLDRELEFHHKQEQLRKNGVYRTDAVKGQEKRLRALETSLKDLLAQRMKLDQIRHQSEKQIPLTEVWLEGIPTPFVSDQTVETLARIRQQKSEISDLIRSSDDPGVIKRQKFIDPQELVVARARFDGKIQRYKSKYESLQQQVSLVIPRAGTAGQNLRGQNRNYIAQIDLQKMETARKALLDRWAGVENPPRILESELDSILDILDQIENQVKDLNLTCDQAEAVLETIQAERMKAQKALENPDFVEMHQYMLQIARENLFETSIQAQDFAANAVQLISEYDEYNRDFGALTVEIQTLFANMSNLWRDYQQQYKTEKRRMQDLSKQLADLRTDLQKYTNHEIYVFRMKTSEKSESIDDWLNTPAPGLIQALREHIRDGQELRGEVQDFFQNEIIPGALHYDLFKGEAENLLKGARTAIAEAENALRKVPWRGTPSSGYLPSPGHHPALDPCYSLLDLAGEIFEEITNPEIEYMNSVEKAIRDLDERVSQNAIKAQNKAEKILQETAQQSDEIKRGMEELRQTLTRGDQISHRLHDTGMRDQWYQIYKEYNHFDREIRKLESYQGAYRYLDKALMEVRFQINRMEKFAESS